MPKNICGFIGNCRVTAEYAHSPQCSEEYATCSNGKRLIVSIMFDDYYFRHYQGKWEDCKCECDQDYKRNYIGKNVESKSHNLCDIDHEDSSNLLYLHCKCECDQDYKRNYIGKNVESKSHNLCDIDHEDSSNLLYLHKSETNNSSRNIFLFGIGILLTFVVVKRFRS